MTSLKEEVKEIVEIVALVPDEHKSMCFEMLLKDALAKRHLPSKPAPHPPPPTSAPEPKIAKSSVSASDAEPADGKAPGGVQPKVNEGSDIVLSDLHVKTKKFLEKGEVTLDQLNDLFYKEGDTFESLSMDLKVTKMSEGQIRIALLQALQNSLATGDFSTTVESVREECKARKTYDLANFTANIKSAADMFDFGTWSKEVTDLRLSEAGKKELASVVKLITS